MEDGLGWLAPGGEERGKVQAGFGVVGGQFDQRGELNLGLLQPAETQQDLAISTPGVQPAGLEGQHLLIKDGGLLRTILFLANQREQHLRREMIGIGAHGGEGMLACFVETPGLAQREGEVTLGDKVVAGHGDGTLVKADAVPPISESGARS